MISKVYIASNIEFKDGLEWIEVKLREVGIEIARNWWKNYTKEDKFFQELNDTQYYENPTVKLIEKIDFQAIDEADMVILYNPMNYPMVGALIELGYAIAKQKICVIYGDVRRSAMHSSCIHIYSDTEFKEFLRLLF